MMASTNIRESEVHACSLAFLMAFLLMGSYYVLRPVRDALASDWTDAEVSVLWTLNFFFSASAVLLYGWAVSYVRFKRLVPFVYISFSLSFTLFYLCIVFYSHPVAVDKTFYVWVSVFSLFHISVFWSFMADLFSKEQAGRLFAIIGAGASAGALAGPSIPTLFSGLVGAYTLLPISSVCLLSVVPIIWKLQSLKEQTLEDSSLSKENPRHAIGGNPFAGFVDFIKNPYLLSIGFFLVLYTSVASIIYFQQKNLLADFTLEQRSQILGAVDWIVNGLTFTIAFFATGRIVKYCGMPVTLSSIPFFMCGGLFLSAIAPVLLVTLLLQVARRAGNYSITRPAREMLFTQVTREERFKAKPVVDIVAYRGGDMVTSWGIASLTQGLGFGMGALAAVGAGIASIWGILAIYIGRTYERDAE